MQSWLPPRQPYLLHLNDLYTGAAKIPLYVPPHFGGRNRTLWNRFDLSAISVSVLNSAKLDDPPSANHPASSAVTEPSSSVTD